MPQITTLIPAYKPTYLHETFDGLARQSCRDFRVIVSDDSPGGQITAMLKSGQFGAAAAALAIEVVPGPGHARLNMRALIDRWAGSTPFAHLQLDDDVVFPDFYAAHLRAHSRGSFCASASHHWVSEGDATPRLSNPLPEFVAGASERVVSVDAAQMFVSMVPENRNWVGEFSHMLISAEGARHWPRPPVDCINYLGWPDVGFVLSAVQHLPLAFIHERLSVFRHHPAQTTHQRATHGARVSHLAWAIYGLQGWADQRLTEMQAVKAIGRCVRELMALYPQGDAVADEFIELVRRATSVAALYASVKPFWLALLASDPVTAPTASTAAIATAR